MSTTLAACAWTHKKLFSTCLAVTATQEYGRCHVVVGYLRSEAQPALAPASNNCPAICAADVVFRFQGLLQLA